EAAAPPDRTRVSTEDEGGQSAADRQAVATATAGLKRVAKLAAEIGVLSKKRVTAIVRGKELTKRDRAALDDLVARFAGEIERLRLQPDRIVELGAELDR